jgi:hypothetical protein
MLLPDIGGGVVRSLCEAAVAVAVIAAVTLGGANLLAGHEDTTAGACAAASSWRAAALGLERLATRVDAGAGDDRDVIGLSAAYRSLASVTLPDAESVPAAALVNVMRDANDAAGRWLLDGLEFVALANSGVATDAQHGIALDEYERSRAGWSDAARRASVELTSNCELAPLVSLQPARGV